MHYALFISYDNWTTYYSATSSLIALFGKYQESNTFLSYSLHNPLAFGGRATGS